jgi:serine/threonine protein kinase
VLTYCHARGVAHCDVKPQNVLLDANDSIKVSDFGRCLGPRRLLQAGLPRRVAGQPDQRHLLWQAALRVAALGFNG